MTQIETKFLPWFKNAVAHEGIYPVRMESDEVRLLIAALESASTDGEGYVMVPREPTEAMVNAGGKMRDQGFPGASDMYRAMIAAVSPAPASKGVSEAERGLPNFKPRLEALLTILKARRQSHVVQETIAILSAITEGKT